MKKQLSKILILVLLASYLYSCDAVKRVAEDEHLLTKTSVIVNDKNGNPVPNADNKIQFFVEGPAIIAGVGNGDSATVEPFKADYRRLFSGKAMLIIQSKAGEAGNIKIRAYSDQLREGTVVVKSL